MARRFFGIAAAAVILALPVRAQESGSNWKPTMGVPPPQELKPPAMGGTPNGNTTAPAGSKTAEGKADGKAGGDKFAALYESYATAWNNPKDLKIAAKHKNRYDLVVFGKKYSKVAGHKVKVKKVKDGKPETAFEIELLDNGIELQGSWSKSYNLFDLTAQVFVGPVPIVITAGVGASIGTGVNGMLTLMGPKSVGVTAYGTAGIGVNVAVALGFKWGCVGVEGSLNLIQGTIHLQAKFESGFAVHSRFTFGSSGEIALVAKVAIVKKRYVIYKTPEKVWIEKVLLDTQL